MNNIEVFWETPIKKLQSLLLSGNSLSVSWSAGKDSTCVLILFLEAMRRLVAEGHSNLPRCTIINCDTRREMPLMDVYAEEATTLVTIYCAKHKLPIEVHRVQPPMSGRFVWYCLGRGKLPRFPGQDHDCAVDEKIKPQQRLIKKLESEYGTDFIALLGSRLAVTS